MQCTYYQSHQCRSCQWLEIPYHNQIEQTMRHVQKLTPTIATDCWLPPVTSDITGFRNKAKMAVSGTPSQPLLGITDKQWQGIDLTSCPLYSTRMQEVLHIIKQFLTVLRIPPYDVGKRRGELKYVHLTESNHKEYMLRLVLRSRRYETVIRQHVKQLQAVLPELRVISINLHPHHQALVEGEEEILLTPQTMLPMPMGDVTLFHRPGGFFQTNTAVATQLYRQARIWGQQVQPQTVLDLFCGVGGFGLFLAETGRRVHGIDVSPDAIAAAEHGAAHFMKNKTNKMEISFSAGDAPTLADQGIEILGATPDLVVVNPPRRGITQAGCDWLNQHRPQHVIYSSCNPVSLASDLAQLPAYKVKQIRLFDMFPHTSHAEVAALLTIA